MKEAKNDEWMNWSPIIWYDQQTNKQTNKQKNKGWGDVLKICKKKTKKQTNSTSMTSEDSHLSET